MKTTLKSLLLVLAIPMLSCHQSKNATSSKQKDETMSFTVLGNGTQCGIKKETLVLIQDNATFSKYWKQLKNNIINNQQTPPKVDFSKNDIILITQGQKNKGGYNVKITKLKTDNGKLNVFADYTSPGANCMVTDVLTYPYELISIPKTKDELVLKKTDKVTKCN